MSEIKRFFIGILTFFTILIILSFAVTLLTIVNIPRIIPNRNLKVLFGIILGIFKIVKRVTAKQS